MSEDNIEVFFLKTHVICKRNLKNVKFNDSLIKEQWSISFFNILAFFITLAINIMCVFVHNVL